MNQWIDASLPIGPDTLVWPGDRPVEVVPTELMSRGAVCNESRIAFGSHCATHIDAPYHFDPNGKCIDHIDPDVLIGPGWLLDVPGSEPITTQDLENIPAGEYVRVFLRTRNSTFLGVAPFREDYVGVDPLAAQLLVDRGCQMVGIDYYSICPYSDLITTHQTLLCNGVIIVESLVLTQIDPGPIDIIALPLRITDGDASPARVMVRHRGSG